MTVLMYLNAVLAAASAAFGIIAVTRPALLVGEPANGAPTRYYAQMYAVRAIPFGILTVAGCLAAAVTTDAETLACVLLIGIGVSQLGDAAIGIRHRILGMSLGAAVAAGVHLVTAAALA